LQKYGIAQRKARDRGEYIDFPPVVKLFTPDADATWLLSEVALDPPPNKKPRASLPEVSFSRKGGAEDGSLLPRYNLAA